MSDTQNFENMSDEELLNAVPPEVKDDEESVEPADSTPTEPQDENDTGSSDDVPEDSHEQDTSTEDTGSDTSKDSAPEVDYKQFYETVMSTTKANGQAFAPRSAEEAVKLIQMGANYTKKMQALAPHRKMIQMLEKANIGSEQQLNYMIDLMNGNPNAIKKLLADSKIDPLDLDLENSDKYVPTNHTISDSEMRFRETIDNLASDPKGQETLQLVNGFDQDSLTEVIKDPSIINTLHAQRTNGVFNLIVNEMQHQAVLGNLNPNTPFLEAYKQVGDYLLSQAQQPTAVSNLPRGTINNPVHETKASVKGVAPTGKSRKPASTSRDPFSMSDEDFEKEFGNYNF